MNTERWIDRTGWSSGPWDDEPDRIDWVDDRTGYPLLMKRNDPFGFWCGYVGLPPGHPWHGAEPAAMRDVVAVVDFVTACQTDDRPARERICHTPAPGEPDDVWWIGFACGGLMDVQPGNDALMRRWAEMRPDLDLPTLRLPGASYADQDHVARVVRTIAGLAAREA